MNTVNNMNANEQDRDNEIRVKMSLYGKYLDEVAREAKRQAEISELIASHNKDFHS